MRRALLLSCASIALLADGAVLAGTGFVVNSDDPSPRDFDALHRVELENGQSVKAGDARSSPNSAPFADIEGLAMSAGGMLYGIDDASKTLLILSQSDGRATPVDGREGNTGLTRASNYDFGLTFDCNGSLFASSDSRRSLYRLNTSTGVATLIGSEGSLGAQITGLAARYDGVFGIGSSGDENLYSIDTLTGRATLVGALGAGLRFTDGGLDFDGAGQLWGVADMTGASINPEPSVVFKIDPSTGAATRASTTLSGVESLAITAPVCQAPVATAPPAIATLNGWGLVILGLMLSLLSVVALRSKAA